MAGLLRRTAARAAAVLPKRGGDLAHGPIKPIGPNFPRTSEKVMGRHGWNTGSYTFWALGQNAIKGRMYRPPWVVGGIHNPTIDPIQHFNTQDRFKTVSFAEYAKCWFYNFLPARVFMCMVGIPVSCVLFVTWIEQRREPMEIFMDREEYFRDPQSYMWGVYFDHHHYSHMLCHRRANKWGYAGQDITLEHGHH